jgi:hypothetical protein
LVIPGIFSAEKSGLLLLRYSIIWFSTSIPVTSWKATFVNSVPRSNSTLNLGMGHVAHCALPSFVVLLFYILN